MATSHLEKQPALVNLPALTYVAARLEVTMDSIGERVGETLDELERYMASRGIEPAGPSLIRYRAVSVDAPFVIEVGWVTEEGIWIDAPYAADVLPQGRYVTATHVGPYSGLSASTGETLDWADAEGVRFDVASARSSGDGPVTGDAYEAWGCWYELYVTDSVASPAGPAGTVEIRLLTAS